MVDRYTKGILTVIAVCMVYNIVVGTSVRPAEANSPIHVIIDSVSSYAFQYAGPLKVKLDH